jgi:hypothetical protein
MARTPNTPAHPTPAIEVLPALAQRHADTQDALTLADSQQDEAVRSLAKQIGYEGSLTVGTLEDEIRFYQRQTVEAILQTGKRLLLLKEMTPRGEFDSRVELLGFSRRTAYRFMQAAFKTSNSANLARIGTLVKSASAFLELVTHDDDELQALDGMDDVDRMSASQLRAALRESKNEKEAVEKLVETKNKIIDRQKVEVDRFEKLPPSEKLQALQKDVSDAMNDARGSVMGRMRQAVIALVNAGDDRGEHDVFIAGLLGQVQADLNALRDEFSLPDVSNAETEVDTQARAAIREALAVSRAQKGGV